RAQRREERRDALSRIRVERRNGQSFANALIRANDAGPAAERGDHYAVAAGQLIESQRRQLQRHVEELVGRVNADRRELAKDGVVHSVGTGEPSSMCERRSSAGLRRAAFEDNDGLSPASRLFERGNERVGVRQSFSVNGDDTRSIVLRERANEVRNAE